jgi:hypothetical protein
MPRDLKGTDAVRQENLKKHHWKLGASLALMMVAVAIGP